MLYKTIVALLVAQSAALTVTARAGSISMADTSWRRSYNGRVGGAAPAAAAPAAASGSMGVAAACKFMEANPAVSFADKRAFLLSKDVSEFVIAQAACTAPDTTLVL